MDQWSTTVGRDNRGYSGATSLADVTQAMKDAMKALGSLRPETTTPLLWGAPLPAVQWTRTISVYAYPADRWCDYTASDYEWAHWCRLGKRIAVEYCEETKEVTKLPEGWVLPADWTYGCDGSRMSVTMDMPCHMSYRPHHLLIQVAS